MFVVKVRDHKSVISSSYYRSSIHICSSRRACQFRTCRIRHRSSSTRSQQQVITITQVELAVIMAIKHA